MWAISRSGCADPTPQPWLERAAARPSAAGPLAPLCTTSSGTFGTEKVRMPHSASTLLALDTLAVVGLPERVTKGG